MGYDHAVHKHGPKLTHHFETSRSKMGNVIYLLDVRPGLESPEEDDGLLGLGVGLDLVGDDQGDLRDVLDAVT